MDVACVGVPWGGGALVSIPSKPISSSGQESRAALHAKSRPDTDVKSLGHRVIEWIAEAGKDMQSRFAEFRKQRSILNVIVNARLIEIAGTPQQYRGRLARPFSLLEATYRQGARHEEHVREVKHEIGNYLKENEGLKEGTRSFSCRSFEIYKDMVDFLTSKYTIQEIRKSQPFRRTRFN